MTPDSKNMLPEVAFSLGVEVKSNECYRQVGRRKVRSNSTRYTTKVRTVLRCILKGNEAFKEIFFIALGTYQQQSVRARLGIRTT